MTIPKEIVGLTNLHKILEGLTGRKVSKDEQRKLSVLSGDSCFVIDGFTVSLKEGTFCCYLISEIV